MLKRSAWIAVCVISVVVFGGLALRMLYLVFTDAEAALDNFSLRVLIWPGFLLLVAGAFAAGIFMTPQEFKEATKPDDGEQEPAAWIKDIRRRDDANDRP